MTVFSCRQSQQRGSLLIYAVMVILFFSALAALLMTVMNTPFSDVGKKEWLQQREADALFDSAVGMMTDYYANNLVSGLDPLDIVFPTTVRLYDEKGQYSGVIKRKNWVNIKYLESNDEYHVYGTTHKIDWEITLSDGHTVVERQKALKLYLRRQ